MDELENPQNSEKLGNYLKRARVAAKIELEKLSRENRINIEFLKAIENSDFEALPGITYTRAYLKSLAIKYNLDPNKILDWYAQETGQEFKDEQEEVIQVQNEGTAQPNYKSNPVLIVVVVVVAAAVLMLNSFLSDPMDEEEFKNEFPVATEANQDSADVADSTESDSLLGLVDTTNSDSMDSASTLALAVVDSAKVQDKPVVAKKEEPKVEKKKAEEEKPTPKKKKLDETAVTVLNFKSVKDTTWFSIKDLKGKTNSRMIREGQRSYRFTRYDTISVTLGDYRGVELKLNNKKVDLKGNEFKVYKGKVLP